MASEERKSADNKIKSDNLFNSLGAGEVQAETDAFQCGRCKQRKCRYRQAQTRSADEPMTVCTFFYLFQPLTYGHFLDFRNVRCSVTFNTVLFANPSPQLHCLQQ